MFGPHLTIDLYGCDPEKLNSPGLIKEVLSEMPGKLGMTKFSEPQITSVPELKDSSFDKGGVTGFVILTGSHMSVHTFPADRYAAFDIFYCREFDSEYACSQLSEMLGAEKSEKKMIGRGREFRMHYPRSAGKAEEIAYRERSEAAKSKSLKCLG